MLEYTIGSALCLSLSLSLSHEIDVDAWEYERTPKYAPAGNFGIACFD